MPRYKLTLSYDGSLFGGWQIQPNSSSIQERLQAAFEKILGYPVILAASGRTDAGVHAKGQVAHFDAKSPLSPSFISMLESHLPPSIRLHTIEEVPSTFHARFSAKEKTYHYHITTAPVLDPFKRLYRTHLNYQMDLSLLKEALPFFIGTHDFSSFANKRGSIFNPIKTILSLDFISEEPEGFRLEFTGKGFLYKMVRNIVGTLVYVAREKIPLKRVPELFEAKDRKLAPPPAPPQGLFLISVEY